MSTRKAIRRDDDDFDREIRAHLELEAERLIDDGLTPDAGAAAARRASATSPRPRASASTKSRRMLWLDHLAQDVRCAARNIARYPVAGAGRRRLARRRHRRHDRHADGPRRRLPQAAAALRATRRSSRGCRSARPDRPITPIGSHVPGALFAVVARHARSAHRRGHAGARRPRRADRRPHRNGAGRARSRRTSSRSSASTPALGPGTLRRAPPTAGRRAAVLSYRVWQRLFDGGPTRSGSIDLDRQPAAHRSSA